MFGPTTGASESAERSWQASRFWARAVGIGVFVAPLAAAWIAVWLVQDVFFQPAGTFGIVLWVLQSIAVASVVAAAVERVARRLLPLQVLLGMSLTFPDHAPSRFKVALRSGTLRKLRSRIPDISDGGKASVQQAAEHAIELVTTLGKHERLTRGHTERVRAYSDLIAVELGLTADERNKLAWAAMLHDIGKLAVPADILNKDSRPTDAEWAILASHPIEGLELLAPLRGWLGDWLLAASEHHERWDGEGYPNGLSGLEISLAGRIVAVADAYDVITSHRSYKNPMSLEAARNELVECAGNQFDPSIVRAMLTASKSDKKALARFAGLLELRTISHAISSVSSAPAAVAASLVAVPAMLGMTAPGLGLPLPTGPSEVAFVQPEERNEGQETASTDPTTAARSATSTTSIRERGSTTTDQAVSPTTDLAGTDSSWTTTSAKASTTSTTRSTTSPTTSPPATASTSTTVASPTTSTSTTSTPTTSSTSTTLSTSSTSSTTTTVPPPADDCERLRNGETDLVGADLASCDVSGMVFANVNLQWADLTSADLRNVELSSFDLSNALMNDALLDGAVLSNGSAVGLTAIGLQASDVKITNVSLANSTLMQSDFSQSDLTGVSYANSSLNRSSFGGSRLQGVNFSSSSLTDADFTDVEGRATDFSDTNSQGALFDRADIRESNFSNSNLGRAWFVDADAEAAVLFDAGLSQANLTRTNLRNASGTPFQTQNATYDATVCPDGVTRSTTCWP